jgi:sialidase-1
MKPIAKVIHRVAGTLASALLLSVGRLLAADAGNPADVPAGQWPPSKSLLFQSGKDGYTSYRIPAVVVTKRGVVLVFCAARKGRGGDWDNIDIAMRRSTDNGRAWEPRRILLDDGDATVDNPTPIVDRQTGSVHFLYQVNYARCYYLRSDDDGQTFTTPVDITAVFEQFRKEYDWNVIAPGPGHAIQLQSGRLLVPVWLSTGGHSHHPSCMATIYSDDHGATWRRGDIVGRNTPAVPNPNETAAVELSDGRVMLNIRNESQKFRRLVAFSPDGATGWTEPVFDDALFEPVCMAGLVQGPKRPGDKIPLLLFSNPDSRNKPAGKGWRARETLSIKASEDDGRTWAVSRVLEPGGSGYSDLAVAADGYILCLYEGGGGLTLARFPVEWIYGNPQERQADLQYRAKDDSMAGKQAAPAPGNPGAAQEPFLPRLSLAKAAEFLDAGTPHCEKNCVACHGTLAYLTARLTIPGTSPAQSAARQAVEKYSAESAAKEQGTTTPALQVSIAVMAAAVLVQHDAATEHKLQSVTRIALDRIWDLQREDGGWNWVKSNQPPSESDDHFGVTMAAIGVGTAPDHYAGTPQAQKGLEGIRRYLREHPPTTMHQRAMVLLAAVCVQGLLTDDERSRTTADLFALQRPDGGWAMASLGNWERADGSPLDPTLSDGYGTGFAVYVLRRGGGVAAEDRRLQQALDWLRTHQRVSGCWFTRSPRKNDVLATYAGTAYALLALDACGCVDPDAP